MYPDQAFWKNKLAVSQFQEALKSWFNKYGINIQAKTPQFVESTEYSGHTLCMARTTVNKISIAYPIGSQDPNLGASLFELVASAANAPKDTKALEVELSRLLFGVLESEFKSYQVFYDPKSFLTVPQSALLDWSVYKVKQVVQLPFSVGEKEFVIDLPMITAELSSQYNLSMTGYPSKARILVVDDSPTSRKITRHYLNLAGYNQIDECEDGKDALAKITGAMPGFDLVIADWHMPNMTGLEMLKRIRMDIEHKDMKIIFATGERNGEEVKNAIKEGVNGYLVKPFEAESVYRAMKKTAPARPDAVKKAS